MIRYAATAVAWRRVTPAVLLAAILLELVRRWPGPLWSLEPAAVGLVAGAAAWCFDEPAALVVDVSPRGLAWRTCARGFGVLAVLGVWSAVVWAARADLLDRAGAVYLQGVGAALAACAWATWRRGWGATSPGTTVAAAAVPAATVWPLGPASERLPLFPSLVGDGWATSQLLWTVLSCAALTLLALAMVEARWWAVQPPRYRSPRPGDHTRHRSPAW